jgi:hypothetical protein
VSSESEGDQKPLPRLGGDLRGGDLRGDRLGGDRLGGDRLGDLLDDLLVQLGDLMLMER